jgi:putative membrane protein
MMGSGWGGWGFGFPGFGMIVIWVLIIVLAVWLVRAFVGTGTDAGPRTGKSARQVLEERYARGEIDRDEFEQKRRDLSG